MQRTGVATAIVGLVLAGVAALAGVWLIGPDGSPSSAPGPTATPTTTPTTSATPTSTATSPSPSPSPSARPSKQPTTSVQPAMNVDCTDESSVAFTPNRIAISHVTSGAHVLAIGYDARGVPGVPPLTSEGKTEFAWVPNVAPGMDEGNVLLNAHTWPDGSALGNHLLAGLQTGGRIVVTGAGGRVLCYRVTDRVEVAATASVPAYFATDGPPQLAIVVCSGIRRGPGDWTERTIWYASPLL